MNKDEALYYQSELTSHIMLYTRMRSLVRAGLVACLVGISSYALAGHYQAGTTSGLTFTASPGGGSPTYGAGTATGTVGGGGGSCSIGGQLTTTFTWVKDKDANGNDIVGDTPPDKVIAIESCSVSTTATTYISSGGGTPGGSSDNGMGSNWSTTTNPSPSPLYVYGGPYPTLIGYQKITSSIGSKATVLSGGASVTVTCSPSAVAASQSGPHSASVTYGATVYPVIVDVSGCKTLADLSRKILPGKGAVGTISTSAPDITFTSHSWTVPGKLFKSFDLGTGYSSGHAIDLDSNELTKSAPQWRWKEQVTSQVQCSATINYKGIGAGTASGKRIVTVADVGSTLEYTFHNPPTEHKEATKIYSGNTNENAIDIKYSATTPNDMVEAGAQGQVGYVQLASWNFSRSAAGISVEDPANTDGFELDNQYPYHGYNTASVGSTPTKYVTRDTPRANVNETTPGVNLGIDGIQSSLGYVMYIAPGSNTMPVNLILFGWQWELTATNPQTGWVSSKNLVSETLSQKKDSTHPDWDAILVNN